MTAAGRDRHLGRQHALVLCLVLYLVHYAIFSWWYVEDAAITFAFAKNAAAWEGFVAYPGGERVEGFSNPTWTLLLTGLMFIGINPWIGAKLLGAICGCVGIWAAMRWAERTLGPESGPMPAIAPLILATSPQFVVWNASGLENSLFCALLGVGSVGLLREVERNGVGIPWSGLAWSFLAFSRPEAAMYSAAAGTVAGFALLMRSGPRAAFRWAARWLALAGGPFLAWHAWRYAYFAWEWPNTYYAKLVEEDRFQPFDWNKRGWAYLRGYALYSVQGVLLPAYVLGQTGLRGWRRIAGLAMCAVMAVLLLPAQDWLKYIPGMPEIPLPEAWIVTLICGIGAVTILAPAIGLGRPRALPRLLAWTLAGVALFFALYSGGDWMKGHRWLSMGSVPAAVLLADAANAFTTVAWPRLRRSLVGAVVVVPVVAGVVGSIVLVTGPETSPFDVRRRVLYMQGVQQRLHLDEVTLLEVDMGAHMWWSGFKLVDMAGLVDVPMARSGYQKPYVRQYVYDERNPDFAHVHGYWARKTKMKAHREWRQFVEIPGYPISPWMNHEGSHVRRDLFISKRWEGNNRRHAIFDKLIELRGWDVPAPQVAAGQGLYLEVAWTRRSKADDFRALVVLSGPGGVIAHDLPPAYDWLRVDKWRTGEAVHGRYTVPLPDDLAPGSYDLAFVVLSADEAGGIGVMQPTRVPSGAETEAPVYATGEVRWNGVVDVVALHTAEETAQGGLEEAIGHADAGECDRGEARYAAARRHLLPDHPWQAGARDDIGTALAICWANKASSDILTDAALTSMISARRWDHRQARVQEVGRALADAWQAEGDIHFAAGERDEALEAWNAAMTADPRRSWVRRRAEELRSELADEEAERTKAEEAKRKKRREELKKKKKKKAEDDKTEADTETPPGDVPEKPDK